LTPFLSLKGARKLTLVKSRYFASFTNSVRLGATRSCGSLATALMIAVPRGAGDS
jgi:hypothetical protein